MRKFQAAIVSLMLIVLSGCILMPETKSPNLDVVFIMPMAAPADEAPLLASDEDFECMRKNIYFEVRNGTRRDMEGVALVTLERVENKHYPDTVCGVVQQHARIKGRNICQFSWYCDGKADEPSLTITVKTKEGRKVVPNKAEAEAWERAGEVARLALDGKIKDWLGNATHYHADYVAPAWAKAKRFKELRQVGRHIFYKDKGLFSGNA